MRYYQVSTNFTISKHLIARERAQGIGPKKRALLNHKGPTPKTKKTNGFQVCMYVFTKKYIYIYIYHHLQTLEVWLHVVLFKCLTPHLLDIFHHFHFSFTCHHSLCHLWGFRCFFGENPTSSALPKSLGGHSSKSLPSVRKPAKEKKH